MSTWTINDDAPEALGLSVTRGKFSSGTASEVYLTAVRGFDASDLFPYGTEITIKRDDSPFFRGKIRQIPKSGNGSGESHEYIVEDAWADLERLTYQEQWNIKEGQQQGTMYSPEIVLGMGSDGNRIDIGRQIREALTFAAMMGVPVQIGSIPSGMMLHPSEASGQSCAQIIRDCLRFNPDWLPWLDHATSPPTFHVTPRSQAYPLSVSVTDCQTLDVSKTHDRVPAGVRIVYTTANMVDDEVFRTVAVDQAPRPPNITAQAWAAIRRGPAALGIITTSVPLAGMKASVQKQQVSVRKIPTNQEDAVAYLKEKFPVIKDLPTGAFTVTEWERYLVAEPKEDEKPPPLDTKLERAFGTSLEGEKGLTNELLDGSLPEWIRRRVGKVLITFAVKKAAGVTLTPAQEKALSQLPPWFQIVGTNAVTKLYKGLSSFEAAEEVPVGVAEAYYDAIRNGCNYAGSITTQGEELPYDLGHGRVLNLIGSGDAAIATMSAPIHTVTWDLATATATTEFGPNPDLSVGDFIEFLKLLNKRPYSSYTKRERVSAEIGDDKAPSANGDSAGPSYMPETITGSGSGAPAESCGAFGLGRGADPNKLTVTESTIIDQTPAGFTEGKKVFTISTPAGKIYGKITIGEDGEPSGAQVLQGADVPDDTNTTFHREIGSFTVTGEGAEAALSFTQTNCGPLDATVCRKWFAAEAPFYGVTWL